MPSYTGPQDAGPSNPGPTGPSTPSPSGPSTPGPTGPKGPTTPGAGARGPRTGGGIVIPMTRQSTSKEILGVEWDYVVPSTFADNKREGPTSAVQAAVALPVADAFAKIAGDDPRPVLVLRECTNCKGTEHALFARRLNNEKTQLLLNWFHCIKLPPEVAKKDHPFHKLFETRHGMPHLFIATAQGTDRVDFSGAQAQSYLQKKLLKLLDVSYKKKPLPAIKSMMKFLSKFDMYDMREDTLLVQIDEAREAKGPNSSTVKKLQRQLADVRAKKQKAMKSAKAVCDLKLKVVKTKKAE